LVFAKNKAKLDFKKKRVKQSEKEYEFDKKNK
jgi:hypothetical protein